MRIIKTALCSFGMSGKVFHAPLLASNAGFLLYAVWERSTQKAHALYPEIKSFQRLEDMLADDLIELVIVNTPNATHFQYAKMALLAGKHVVVEKQFTSTVEEATELFALAASVNKKITVFQNRRWDSDFLTVKKVVDQRMLGEVVEAEFHFDRFKMELGPKLHKETPGIGAGILPDLGPHLVDQALQMFGSPYAIFADAAAFRTASMVDDYFELLMFYKGLRVRLKASYLVREAIPAYVIHGTKGSFLKYRDDVQELALQAGKLPGNEEWGIPSTATEGLLHTEIGAEVKKFNLPSERGNYGIFYSRLHDAIVNDEPLPVTAAEALCVVHIIESAFKSIAEKKCVYLDPAICKI